MRNIPTRFTLLGRDHQVKPMPQEMKDGEEDGEGLDGLYDQNHSTIYINTDRPKQYQMATFGHEIVHALLEAAGRPDLSSNEGLVDCLGQLLHQVLKTSKGNLNATTL